MKSTSFTLDKIKKSVIEGGKIGIVGLGRENCQFLEWAIDVAGFKAQDFVLFDQNEINLENYPLLKSKQEEFEKVEGEGYLDGLVSSLQKNNSNALNPFEREKSPPTPLNKGGVELKSNNNSVNVDYLIKSPGIWSLDHIFEEYRKTKGEDKIISSLVFFFEKYRDQIIAITGTKGKSTTSGLANSFLNANQKGVQSFYCGNTTNISPYRFWIEMDSKVDPKTFFVIEISSFQLQDLGYSKISPKYAIITNLYIDHLDQHSNVKEYWQSKFNIFEFQKKGDFLCLNEDTLDKILDSRPLRGLPTPFVLRTFPPSGENTTPSGFACHPSRGEFGVACYTPPSLRGAGGDFSLSKGFRVDLVEGNYDLSQTSLVGEHNLQNIWMASKVASGILGVDQYNSDFQRALDEFKNFSHRLEFIVSKNFVLDDGQEIRVNFYDDGAASEPEAVLAGVKALTEEPNSFVWLQLTGKDKGGVLKTLVEEILNNQNILRVDFCGQVGKRVYDESLDLANSKGSEALNKLELISSFSSPGQSFKELIGLEFEEVKFEKVLNEILETNESSYTQTPPLLRGVGGDLRKTKTLNILLSPCGSSFDEFNNYDERAKWWVKKAKDLVNS